MSRRSLTLTVMAALAAGSAAADEAADREAVKAVVRSAYVEGVHAKGDPALMRQGFHPDFRMLVLRDGAMTAVTLEDWVARLEKGARERTEPRPAVAHEFTHVDVTGNAAVARVEITRAGKHVFTDYLSLYRFPDGWKIVGKIFQGH
jgi:ketosteroid isomerase-like protein